MSLSEPSTIRAASKATSKTCPICKNKRQTDEKQCQKCSENKTSLSQPSGRRPPVTRSHSSPLSQPTVSATLVESNEQSSEITPSSPSDVLSQSKSRHIGTRNLRTTQEKEAASYNNPSSESIWQQSELLAKAAVNKKKKKKPVSLSLQPERNHDDSQDIDDMQDDNNQDDRNQGKEVNEQNIVDDESSCTESISSQSTNMNNDFAKHLSNNVEVIEEYEPLPVQRDAPHPIFSEILYQGHRFANVPVSLSQLWIATCKKLLEDYVNSIQEPRKTLALNRLLALPRYAFYCSRKITAKVYWKEVKQRLGNVIQSNNWGTAIMEERDENTELNGAESANNARNWNKERRNISLPSDSSFQEHNRMKRAGNLLEMGHLSRAARILKSNSIMANLQDTEIREKLEELHPQSLLSDLPELPESAPLCNFSAQDTQELDEIMKHSNDGSAPGPSGWGGNMVSCLLSDSRASELFHTLIQDIINGNISAKGKEWLTSSKLIAISKPDGGIRPISMGEIFLKIAGKYSIKKISKHMAEYFPPCQFGVGVKAGAEKIVHSIRHFLSKVDEENFLMSLDVKNAFNTISRKHVLEALYGKEQFSSIWKLVDFCYSSPSSLFLANGEKLSSTSGVRQGDPLSSFLFALAINPLLENTNRNNKVQCLAYLDDINICGSLAELLKSFSELSAKLSQMGLSCNFRKCGVTASKNVDEMKIDDGLTEFLEEKNMKLGSKQVKILGINIENLKEKDSELSDHAQKEISNFNQYVDRICNPFFSAQNAMLLLKFTATPKFNYSSRCTPPGIFLPQAKILDAKIRSAAKKILELSDQEMDSPSVRKQLALPTRFGGFGLQSIEKNSEICYLSSLASCSSMEMFSSYINDPIPDLEQVNVDIGNCLQKLVKFKNFKGKEILPKNSNSFFSFFDKTNGEALQHTLQTAMNREQYEEIKAESKESGDARRIARLNCITSQQSNQWKIIIPSKEALRLDNEEYRIASRLNLGLLPPFNVKKCPSCSKDFEQNKLDQWHLLSCNYYKRRQILYRHNTIVNAIHKVTQQLGGTSRIEPNDLSEHDRRKPDLDVIINNKRFFLDIRITHPLANSNVHFAAKRRLGAARRGEEIKIKKYQDIAVEHSAEVVPFVIETLGGIGESAKQFLKELWRASFNCEDGRIMMSSFMELMAILIQKGNASVMDAGFRRWMKM